VSVDQHSSTEMNDCQIRHGSRTGACVGVNTHQSQAACTFLPPVETRAFSL